MVGRPPPRPSSVEQRNVSARGYGFERSRRARAAMCPSAEEPMCPGISMCSPNGRNRGRHGRSPVAVDHHAIFCAISGAGSASADSPRHAQRPRCPAIFRIRLIPRQAESPRARGKRAARVVDHVTKLYRPSASQFDETRRFSARQSIYPPPALGGGRPRRAAAGGKISKPVHSVGNIPSSKIFNSPSP